MNDIGIGIGPLAHEYARTKDERRKDRAENEVEEQSKEGRIRRRLARKEVQDNEIAAGNVLYGPGIDDPV